MTFNHQFVCLVCTILWPTIFTTNVAAQWPEAAGPNHDYQVDGRVPSAFSVTRNQQVIWKVPLPNTGESTPVVSGGRIFVTCHAPMRADAELGREILAMCFDARDGKELWRRELPASRATDMASGFSDNTAASPVTDGKHVCFVNVGGSIRTYDFEGNLVWQLHWVPFGRHHARQQEPIVYDGNVILLKTVADDLPVEATTKAGAKSFGRGTEIWTRLHAYDLATGELRWVAQSATSVHSASLLGKTVDGRPAIMTGRGGGHQPPEEPYGLSLIDASSGETIWDLEIKGYAAHQNAVWKDARGAVFVGMDHHLLDVQTGTLNPAVSLNSNVELCCRKGDDYVTVKEMDLSSQKKKRPITYHTNIVAGDYHYFRTHHEFLLGRIHLKTNKVQYLQVPAQVIREDDAERLLWDHAVVNDARNNDGFVVCQDKRAKLSGWGHVSAASPIVVGDYLYMPTMVGTVYVIRWNSTKFDESALVSISDLGPAGRTWTLSSLAYDRGRLYARTMKELICIGETDL